MKSFIVVKEKTTIGFEKMMDGLSEQGFEVVEGSFSFSYDMNESYYICLMSKEIE